MSGPDDDSPKLSNDAHSFTFSGLNKQIQLIYYQYEVTFSAYVLTPLEKVVLNSIVLVLLSIFLFGTTFYLPRFLSRVVSRLVWLYTGPPPGLRLVSTDNTTMIWEELAPLVNY